MSSEYSDEFAEIRGALGSIGLSALLVIVGKILGQATGFGTRIVMTRFLPVDGYGEIVLGITVLNILGIVSMLGLGQAFTRYLPRADSDKERTEITASIYQIGIGLSLFWGMIGFIAADFIARTIFGSPGMANIVRIFTLSLPFYVLFKLSLRGIQGHKKTASNVITKQLIKPGVQLVAVTALSLAGFRTLGLAIGYNLGFAVAGSVGCIFFLKTGKYEIRSLLLPSDLDRYRDILAFSLPLAISASFGLITKKSDIFLLGILDTNSAVGIYDIAYLFSQFILFFSPVLNYLFQPIISEYDANDDRQRMKQLYTIITRWLIMLTFPVFALFILSPEILLATFFGDAYRAGATALSVLATGFFVARFVGLSDSFLTATGDTRVLMYISGITAALNLGANLVLIPIYGIVGAAMATGLSLLLNNSVQSIYIYKSTGIHPFTRELLIPTSLTIIMLSGVKAIFLDQNIGIIATGVVVVILCLFFLINIAITRSIYLIELKLADALFDRIGIHLHLESRFESMTVN
jgi:O-antigen/teichoic acid export membrane protein